MVQNLLSILKKIKITRKTIIWNNGLSKMRKEESFISITKTIVGMQLSNRYYKKKVLI
jgi:hypothetical protein